MHDYDGYQKANYQLRKLSKPKLTLTDFLLYNDVLLGSIFKKTITVTRFNSSQLTNILYIEIPRLSNILSCDTVSSVLAML